MVYYGTTWLTTTQKAGVGLSASGAGLLFMGCLLFFNRRLLTMGNLLFLLGLIFIIGPSKTGAFFFRRAKWRGSLAFSLGFLLILYKYAILGMAVEFFGFLNLFGDFFPYLLMFVRRVPVVGKLLSLPYVSNSNKYYERQASQPGFEEPMLRPRPNTSPINPNAGAKCQKCLQAGHWTYDCPNQRAYRPRPTRSALLANPELRLPEATMVPVDFEEERRNAIADILGKQQEQQAQEPEENSNSEDSGTTDYETDSDFTTDTETSTPLEEGEMVTGREGLSPNCDAQPGDHLNGSSSSGFSSSEDSESEAPLKRSKS